MSKMTRKEVRQRRHRRVRGRISGSAEIPRMSVCLTDRHIHVQFIDDTAGVTLAAASTLDRSFRESNARADMDGAVVLGKIAAERAKSANVTKVVFDRGGFRYHGRLKALADAAREAGLEF